MLLRRIEDGWLAVTQPAHAWLSGELSCAWGGGDFAVPRPTNLMIQAAALHDVGWLSWERAPRLDDETGLPLVFAKVPAEQHTELWRRGVAYAGIYDAFVALLVSRHGDAIYERTFDAATARPEAAEAVRTFLGEQHAFQADTIARLAMTASADLVTAAHLALTKRFIVAVDTLSLHLIWGLAGEVTLDDVPDREGEPRKLRLTPANAGAIAVAPWPFRVDRLEVSVEARHLARKVASQAALDAALGAAALVRLPVVLVPG